MCNIKLTYCEINFGSLLARLTDAVQVVATFIRGALKVAHNPLK